MSLFCGGQTGGIHSAQHGGPFKPIQDGDSLDTLIRMADEHRHRCEWEVCSAGEREHPERTVQSRTQVHLKWVNELYGENFAVLRHLDYDVWDAWRPPWLVQGQGVTEGPAVRLTRKDVNYEMALMAVFRAMGDEMPEEFTVVYL
jgi:hypothetical protein